MAKRKVMFDDEEDEQDQDNQSHQGPDDDYEPPAGDQDNEEAQGESGDGGVDLTLEDNTPEVPLQSATELPQVRMTVQHESPSPISSSSSHR